MSAFINLSISNKLNSMKNVNLVKKRLIMFLLGIPLTIFLFILQDIFQELIKIESLTNITPMINPSEEIIKNNYFWIAIIVIELIFIVSFSLKTSFFSSLIPILFLIPIQYFIPVIDIKQLSTPENLINAFLIITFSMVFLALIRVFFNQKIILTSILFLFLTLIIIICHLTVSYIFTKEVANVIIFLPIILISSILFFVCFFIIDNILIRITGTNLLRESILFDNKFFVKSSYSESYFNSWVSKNSVDQGLMLLFKIENEEYIYKLLGNKNKKYIYNTILPIITEELRTKFIFLRTENGEFCFFTKIISGKEMFNIIKSILGELPKFIDFRNQQIPILFKFYGAIYGRDANDFKSIMDCIKKATYDSGINNENDIIMYDYKKTLKVNKKNDFLKLEKSVNLEKVKVDINYKNGIWKVFVIFNFKKYEDINKFIEKIDKKDIQELLIRNIAYKALKLFKYEEGKLELPFLGSIIESSNFDINDFLDSINHIGIKFSNIKIKLLDLSKVNELLIYKKIIDTGIII